MVYEAIKYEREDGICVITLNKPKALNALSMQMSYELEHAVDEITKDTEINVFVLTGAPREDGRPCFCAGADLKESAAGGRPTVTLLTAMQSGWTGERAGSVCMEKIERCPKLSVAAIDGVCTAGGLELAMACDIILVSETALISDLHVKNLGLTGGAASAQRLAWRVGVAKAIELSCTGDVIDGKEAHRIGFANQVFSPDKLLDGAREMAKKIATMRPAAVTMTKATCKVIYDMDYRSAWRFSDACTAVLRSPETGGAEWGAKRWVEKERR